MTEKTTYDLIIIGGGPAGLTAGIYAQRAGLNTVLLEKELTGGQINEAPTIENYPGFIEISGMELANKMKAHAVSFGLPIQTASVELIKENNTQKTVVTDKGELETKAIIIATGAKPRHLEVEGEKEFIGRGVSYCGTCDGPFFKNKVIAAIGGGDRALKEGLHLSTIASKVYLIHRRDEFRAEKINIDRLKQTKNVEFILNSVVDQIKGNQKVTSITIRNVNDPKVKEIAVDGVFVFVGTLPRNNFLDADKDANGFLITNENLETSVTGIFAAGDCRSKILRQVATAVGEGSLAVANVEEYLHSID